MFSETGILKEIRVTQQDGPLTFWEMDFQLVEAAVCCRHISLTGVKQVEVIPGIVQMFVVGIVVGQTVQLPFTESRILQLVLEDDARA